MSDARRGLPLTKSQREKIFPKLTSVQIDRIATRGHVRSMEEGEVLYEQGHRAAPFFVVISGELEVVRPSVPVETLVTTYESGLVNLEGSRFTIIYWRMLVDSTSWYRGCCKKCL